MVEAVIGIIFDFDETLAAGYDFVFSRKARN